MEKNAETTCRALILNVMVFMMDVDGTIDDREIERIGDIYEEISGFRLEAPLRDKLIGSVTTTRDELLNLLRTRAGVLDIARRQRIFRAGRLVLEADARADPREWRLLRDVGLALGIADDDIDAAL